MEPIIIDGGSHKYLGEFMQILPKNCLFNKTLTGCGGSTIALTNLENYVIAVPFRALIENKKSSNANILGVYAGVTEEEIKGYLEQSQPYKIMVTYDSMNKLLNYIDPLEYSLLVDESHKLIDSGSFRYKAIKEGVLDNFRKFKDYTFMTATPVKDRYQHPELKGLQKIIVKWDNLVPVSVNYSMLYKDFNKKIASLVVDYFLKVLDGNPYFFINSVTSIVEIIKLLKKAGYDDPSLYKIIVSNNDQNVEKIKKGLGKKYQIDQVNSPNKKITFITSTCFEGCDIFDQEGITYILTDGLKDSTKIDILTLMPQIIGRIRDSKFKYNINVIFSPSPYFSSITEEEFEYTVKEQLAQAEEYVKLYYSTTNEMIKKTLYKDACTNAFIRDYKDNLEVNTEAWYSEMHNFESLRVTYYVRKDDKGLPIQKTTPQSILINDVPYNYIPKTIQSDISQFDKLKLEDRVDFSKIAKEYCENKEKNLNSSVTVIINNSEQSDYKLISEAYTKIGPIKMKALNYRRTRIEKEILIQDNLKSESYKIIKLLNLQSGEFISAIEAKDKIQKVYDQLNIKKKAMGRDLSKWYEIKEITKRFGKDVIKGYSIITTTKR